MMFSSRPSIFAALLVAGLLPEHAQAWGIKVTGSSPFIAERYLDPTVRTQLGAMLPGDTAVIFGGDRAKFGEPEKTLQGKRICVTGQVELYRGTPEIVLHDREQLQE